MFYRFMRIVANVCIRPFLKLTNKVVVEGMENIPQEGPLVIASNHLSMWDPIYIYCFVQRKMNFMAKAELFRIPVIGWIVRHMDGFPVNRQRLDRQALKSAADVLSREEALLIFPEGTRSKDGRLLPFFDGASLFAYRSKAWVLPVAVINTPQTFPKGFRKKVVIRFGVAYQATQTETSGGHSEALKEMTQELRGKIETLQAGE